MLRETAACICAANLWTTGQAILDLLFATGNEIFRSRHPVQMALHFPLNIGNAKITYDGVISDRATKDVSFMIVRGHGKLQF
jgi:hypothetical protein